MNEKIHNASIVSYHTSTTHNPPTQGDTPQCPAVRGSPVKINIGRRRSNQNCDHDLHTIFAVST